ncbi:hypothetical protein TNCV_387881 [Trichonephila clavipes]|nr:hypothetical protein TNCV_387881 [Trichonephila clavipes]
MQEREEGMNNRRKYFYYSLYNKTLGRLWFVYANGLQTVFHGTLGFHEGIDSTTAMVRKYKDSTPQVSPPWTDFCKCYPWIVHHFTETVQSGCMMVCLTKSEFPDMHLAYGFLNAMDETHSCCTLNVTPGGKLPATPSSRTCNRNCSLEDCLSWTRNEAKSKKAKQRGDYHRAFSVPVRGLLPVIPRFRIRPSSGFCNINDMHSYHTG